jgi:hypothetical protein
LKFDCIFFIDEGPIDKENSILRKKSPKGFSSDNIFEFFLCEDPKIGNNNREGGSNTH